AEINFFPTVEVEGNLSRLTPGAYMSMYHESDPKYAVLGITKNRCFVINPVPSGGTDASNITCGGAGYPPAWTGGVSSGFNPNEIAGQPGKTNEFTKIIPDQLTPGSHVEYYVRRSILGAPLTDFTMAPDINTIVPQVAERNYDGHRWQEFSVLPDRWKDPLFGGSGMACMLVLDLGDRRGDELSWKAIADSSDKDDAVLIARRGASDGWTACGGDPLAPCDFSCDVIDRNVAGTAFLVNPHLGQAGKWYDLYQTKAGESDRP